ncbi:MAG: UvrD-helicase domain-containing protein [Prevotella sp.]|nr:UvrD-helicase domain-containing protein [Prevotella sp.]
MSRPTKAQQTVIDSTANQIAISASAGSGKTTTMINRIAHILQMKSCRVDEILVLTFTDASAQDMRQKLKKQLGDVLSPVELQAAAIGTFHSFCANLVRAWFSVAEVSPSFAVMDAIESAKIKTNVFEQVVLNHYQDVATAVDLFAVNRNLDELRDVVFKIHAFLATRRDREAWLKETALAAYEPDVDRNAAVCALMEFYRQTATKYRALFIGLGHTSPQIDRVVGLANQIIHAKTYADFQRLDLSLPTLKREPDFVLYEDFKTLRADFREKVCKPITEQFKFPVSQIQVDIAADRHIVAQLLQLVQIFDTAYSTKKAEYKKLDFDDLEKYALKVLSHPAAVAAIRAQYRYIFVDEGQDTNPVQFAMIDILRGDDKFFCIVGDTKQSIYGFRDCEPELFDAMTTARLIQSLRLNQNFRSVDPILHFVNQVMQPLLADYATAHQFVLTSQPDLAALQQVVKIETAQDLPSQMELVYQRIVQSQRPFAEIAVLSETGTHFERLQKYLAARNIPSVIDRKTNALEEPEIVLLNHCLFAAMNPTNELSRYIVLQNLFDCSNDDLARIRLGKIDATLARKVAKCDQVLAHYRQLGRTQATEEVLTQVATEFGMLEIPVVNAYLGSIRGVNDFDTVARYLYLIEHQLVTIEINVGAHTTNAVKLMTIHHAKGLEFPCVILFHMGALWSQHHDSGKIALDKNLGICVASVDTENYVHKSPVLRLGILKHQQARLLAEKKRLLYVALTRAKEELYIVGTWQRNPYLIQPNSMLDLINPLGVVARGTVAPSAVIDTTTMATVPQPKVCQAVGHPEILVKQSVTALATAEPFQDYVAPVKYSDAGGKAFGTAYHRQIQYGMLPPAVQNLVDGYTVYRELPFLYLQDQTIVQGIMDLLAVKGTEAIIVDYKTTRLPRANLVAKYREQLRLYAQAIPQYQVRTYIYSTVHAALIEVSF